MSLCMASSTITVSNANSNSYNTINKTILNTVAVVITFECFIASIIFKFELTKCETSPNNGDKTHIR